MSSANGADPGIREITAPVTGTVVAVPVRAGDAVPAGAALVVLECMKMEHTVRAEHPGLVRAVHVETRIAVTEGTPLLLLAETAAAPHPGTALPEATPDRTRPELAEVIARHRLTTDAARPTALARRRAAGRRTARENIADLCDRESFVEYGALTVAGQRARREMADLVANTPADGMIAGIGTVEGRSCAVLAYDYTVLAGTQGIYNHRKLDRLIDIADRQRLPAVIFTEGGGGRPGDTDTVMAAGLDVPTFAQFARLSGRVPLVAVVAGRCFAGNAALAGCCDLIIATEGSNLGMGGPAMIEGARLGAVSPEEIGPMNDQTRNGVVDILVPDEAAAVATARRYLALLAGPTEPADHPDQQALRTVVPGQRRQAYDIHDVIDLLADRDSVLELRPGFGRVIVTAFARLDGRAIGVLANNPLHLGGAIDTDGATKAARFLRHCDTFGVPVISLCDTPGFLVGPDAERAGAVRHYGRMFVAGAALRIPLITIVVRKAYGLGAMAMAGGSLKRALATLAWPTAEFGGMGLEGAVTLGYRHELAAIDDPAARQARYEELVTDMYETGRALNTASLFEIDDVIDPADTRAILARLLAAAPPAPPRAEPTFLDTW